MSSAIFLKISNRWFSVRKGRVGSLGATAGASFYWFEATTRARPPLPAAMVDRVFGG